MQLNCIFGESKFWRSLYIVFNFQTFSGQGHQGKDDELGTFGGNDLAPLEKFPPPGKLQSIYYAKLFTFLRYNI